MFVPNALAPKGSDKATVSGRSPASRQLNEVPERGTPLSSQVCGITGKSVQALSAPEANRLRAEQSALLIGLMQSRAFGRLREGRRHGRQDSGGFRTTRQGRLRPDRRL